MQLSPNQDPIGRASLIDEHGRTYELNDDGTVSFTDVAHKLVRKQAQYVAPYTDGGEGYPALAADLGLTDGEGNPGSSSEYHSLGIPPDSVEPFVTRYKAYLTAKYGRAYGDDVVQELDHGASTEEIATAKAAMAALGVELPDFE